MKEHLETFKKRYDPIHHAYWTDVLGDTELAAWHQAQLREVVGHVKRSSPFYSRHLAQVDERSLTLDDLATLPFTTKDDLREAGFDILSGPLEDSIFYYETTGTTGPATPCPRDRKESYTSNRQLAMAYQAVIEKHFPGEKTVVGIMGPTEVHSFGDTLGDVCTQLDLCNAKIWPHSPVIGWPKALQLLKDLRIGVLASAPGLLLAMAKEAERQGLNPREDFALRAFMMSGELCTPALKNNLYSLWGAQAYNSLYGSQEAMIIAACNANDQLVPHRLNYIIEVLDPKSGESLGCTGDGELCVTMLIPGSKPLIRYRTGDLVSIQSRPSYPQSMRQTVKVVGRVKDAVQLNDRAFSAAQIEQALLEGVEQCLGYQIILSRANGRDTVIAKLEMSRFFEGDRGRLVLLIKERLRERLGVDATVMVVGDLAEHVNLGSWFSWKEARIVDQRQGQ
ncbi:phenylacetate-CoA ligase [Pseudomonas sp. NFIX10]|uniref:phenylacetate--CoA ligase family protein n=1 Tax=unclassified Pseudomonas TaxID=196821 RepID=UPI0008E2B76F|nr:MULTISPECIES: phenylacetate--CoA ligase family protein [unclassified Pseudomonas]SFB46217.1 phenylacetate-CoA ligase [Pseudomonas sp. NFIX10]SFF18459.1 phenylacetate-CoA ligase [Pseudomonas sp. NFACC06-1]